MTIPNHVRDWALAILKKSRPFSFPGWQHGVGKNIFRIFSNRLSLSLDPFMLFSGLHELRGARFSFFFPFLF
jgi:hypothetical protein